MNTIKFLDEDNDEILLGYEDHEELWIKSTSRLDYNNFIRYNGYTYILKKQINK